jgi:hypothetical protein
MWLLFKNIEVGHLKVFTDFGKKYFFSVLRSDFLYIRLFGLLNFGFS